MQHVYLCGFHSMISVNFQLSEPFRIRIRCGPNSLGQSSIYCKRITVNIAHLVFATLE